MKKEQSPTPTATPSALEQEIAQLRHRAATAEAETVRLSTLLDDAGVTDEKIGDDVRRRMAFGVSRPMAIRAALAQAAHDSELAEKYLRDWKIRVKQFGTVEKFAVEGRAWFDEITRFLREKFPTKLAELDPPLST